MRLFFLLVMVGCGSAQTKSAIVNEATVMNFRDDMQKCVTYAKSHEQAKECVDAVEAKYAPTFADAGVK